MRGPSLAVLATVFRVNSKKGKERLRTFQCVEFVLSMSVRLFFQATDSLALVVL